MNKNKRQLQRNRKKICKLKKIEKIKKIVLMISQKLNKLSLLNLWVKKIAEFYIIIGS